MIKPLDTSTLGPIRLIQPAIHDPGSPPYEAARALLVAELRAIGMGREAEWLEAGELYDMPPWVAMQVMARLFGD